jgi:predicted MFS family arabinose efflux permease
MSGERSLLRRRPVVALLAAEVVSMTGSQMTWLALPWFVLVTTGSATRMTLVVGAEFAGLAALALPGSRLLRRWGAWRTMVACDAARAPLMAAIPLLHWAGALSLGVLLATTFALGALTAPYFAAQKMIVPELLGEDERLVTRANALFQGATRITLLLGPVTAGVLISAVSAPAVLVVDGLTYVAASVLVLGLVPRPRPAAAAVGEGSIRQGLRFLARERLLRVWTPVFALGDAAWAAFFISVPVLVVSRFDADPRVAGWLLASFGVGAVAGNVVAYRLVERVDGLGVIAACIMGQALPLWVLTVELPPLAYSAALAASGLANGLVNPAIHSLMTLRIPPPLRPTVMTTTMLVFVIVQPLGIFAAGPILDAFGARPVLFGFAAVQTLTMAVIMVTTLRVRGSVSTAEMRAAAG